MRRRRWKRMVNPGGRKGRRVSSSCNVIDSVAVHHVDTILVGSFQALRVVGVASAPLLSTVAGPLFLLLLLHLPCIYYTHISSSEERKWERHIALLDGSCERCWMLRVIFVLTHLCMIEPLLFLHFAKVLSFLSNFNNGNINTVLTYVNYILYTYRIA